MRTYVIALAAALTMLGGSFMPAAFAQETDQSPGIAPVSTGSCAIKKTEIATSASFDESTSQSFVNLGDAGSITFIEGTTGCVAGTFFANAGNTANNDNVVLQILLDNSTACAPLTGGYVFANSGTDLSSHAVAFFCGASIAPGAHTIQVQYHSGFGGNVEFFQRTLEVTHK